MDKKDKDIVPMFFSIVFLLVAVWLTVMWIMAVNRQRETEAALLTSQDEVKKIVQERDSYHEAGLRCDSKLKAANEELKKCHGQTKYVGISEDKCVGYLVRCIQMVDDFILQANAINAGYELPAKETK